MPENHEKSEVISDRPTDIVNYRLALTRLKTKIYGSLRNEQKSQKCTEVSEMYRSLKNVQKSRLDRAW